MTPKKRPVKAQPPLKGPIVPPKDSPVFDASSIQLQRRMRFNPLRMLDPEMLSIALDQFDIGILRQAAIFWDAMWRRDDTLSFVKPQLESAIAAKPWGVFKVSDADPMEAARHEAALKYFWDNVTAVDAFDRNKKGGRHLLLKQMGESYAMMYAAHHFVWKPTGKMIDVEGAAPVPALTAEMEYVPLWFFENTTGTLRFLPFGGFGIEGQELDWDGEWVVTTGQGIMFAASICYTFKRMAFQDWTTFNERYAQAKVAGMTNAQKDSSAGQAMEQIVSDFNGDMGMVFYECQNTEKPPVQLIGPNGTVSVELWEKFLDRQDRKMTVMFRGSDLRNMSREKDTTGVSAQSDETDAMEIGHCANIMDSCRAISRQVIKFCFGPDVEPLAYFGLPDAEKDDANTFRENAGFLADRGALVALKPAADRLGVTLTDKPEEALTPIAGTPPTDDGDGTDRDPSNQTANAASCKLTRLRQLVEETLRTQNSPDEPRDENGEWTALSPKGQSVEISREQQTNSIAAVLRAVDKGEKLSASLGRVPQSLADRVRIGTAGARDIAGAELRIDADFVQHARNYHPNLTDDDFHAIPELMHHADRIAASQTRRNAMPAVEFHRHLDGREHLLIGASLNKQGHFQMTTLKKSAENRAS